MSATSSSRCPVEHPRRRRHVPGHLTPAGPSTDRPFAGVLFMLAGIASFCCMDAIVKWLTGMYPLLQVIALRSWCGWPFLLLIVHFQGGFSGVRTRRPKVHLLRFLFVLGLTVCFFWGLSQMKLVDAVALTFVAPILVAVLSVPILGESVGRHRWTAILAGFVGVIVMLRPGSGVFQWASVVVLLSALCYALLMVTTRKFKSIEHPGALMFWPATGLAVVGLVVAPIHWVTPTAGDLLLFVLAGMFGSLGIVGLTNAFRLAPAALASPFEYTALIWATVLGYLLWGDLPDRYTLIGAAIIVASGLYILYRETVRRAEAGPMSPGIQPNDAATPAPRIRRC